MIERRDLWRRITLGAAAGITALTPWRRSVAQTPVASMPAATTPLSGSELFYVVQNGQDHNVSFTQLAASVKPTTTSTTQAALRDWRCGVIIPYYFYTNNPYSDPTFTGLVALIRQYHSVPTIVVLNQSGTTGNGGPGPYDGNIDAAIRLLQAAGAIALGYVDSGLGTRAALAVQSDVVTWTTLYGDNPPYGIFFDNAPYNPGTNNSAVLLYQSYYQYAYAQGYTAVAVNPGSNQQSAWYQTKVADIMMTWENSSYPSVSTVAGNYVGGHGDFDWRQNGILVYGQSSFAAPTLTSLTPYVKWVYVTSGSLPNPWGALPSYLAQIYAVLAQVNCGNTGGISLTSGAGAPSGTQPNAALYSRNDGSTGTRLYVSTGSAWTGVSGV